MKEVCKKRYAGPFKSPPFEHYIQSPIGLVPKDQRKDVRLIFHLSYPRNPSSGLRESVNTNTPAEYCHVKYADFDSAVQRCIEEGIGCRISKSDFTAAFRNLGIRKKHWKFLLMKARNPLDKVFYYFVDKCLPFGSSISCAQFQAVSDAVAHLVQVRIHKRIINYLDDYLFVAYLEFECNRQVRVFMEICLLIKMPVSLEKMHWATTRLVFLGLLLDTVEQLILLPKGKIERRIDLINAALNKQSGKITLKELQRLTGFLNFLGRGIVPGRAFTRRLYSYAKVGLKPYHHICLNAEIKRDLQLWLTFLHHPSVFSRPFVDCKSEICADAIDMFSDSSGSEFLGFGATCGTSWMYQQWNANYIRNYQPSIEYLELFALVAGVKTWIHRYTNRRVILFCDNKSVVDMVNASSSSCKNCMVLIRFLVLEGLINNVRIFARHVEGRKNYFSDALSRLKISKFWELAEKFSKEFEPEPTPVPNVLFPMEKLWVK